MKGQLDGLEIAIPITLLNISVGGACLAIDSTHWAKLESEKELKGSIHFPGESAPFEGEVRWSSSNEQQTLAGIAFNTTQPSLIAKTLELLIQKPLEHGTAFKL